MVLYLLFNICRFVLLFSIGPTSLLIFGLVKSLQMSTTSISTNKKHCSIRSRINKKSKSTNKYNKWPLSRPFYYWKHKLNFTNITHSHDTIVVNLLNSNSHDFLWLLYYYKSHVAWKFHWNSSSRSEDFLRQY